VRPILHVRAMCPVQAPYSCPPLPPVHGSPGSEYSERIGRPDRPQPPFRRGLPGAPPQEPSGPPKFLTLLSTPTTLFVDPDRPAGNSPKRVLCVGFWGVTPIAVCMSRDHGAVSSVRECGLPYGLRGALCTLHPCCSVCTSFTGATLGRSGWLDLPPQGLTPCKKHQASLGALTLALTCCRKRERSGRWRQSGAAPDCVKTQCGGRR
jgi:hypothetical protein